MKTRLLLAGVAAVVASTLVFAQQRQAPSTLDIYFIDTEGGHSTLYVAPTGESMLVDSGNPGTRDVDRIVAVLNDAGVKQIYLVTPPIYDFASHTRHAERMPFASRPVILLDGTLILSQPGIREQLDWSLFIETRESIRFDRRFHRDRVERGRQPDGIRKQFEQHVKPMHDLYVEPSKGFANEIISGESSFEARILHWARLLSS